MPPPAWLALPLSWLRARRCSSFSWGGSNYAEALKKLPPILKVLQEVAQNHGKTVSQVELNWTICKGALPIPCAKNARQAGDNAGGAGWRLTDDEVALLDEVTDNFRNYGGTVK